MQDRVQIQKAVTEFVGAGIATFVLSLDAGTDGTVLHGIQISDPPRQAADTRRPGRGTYFTNNPLFRMTATTSDVGVLAALTTKMLGPGTRFEDVGVLARTNSDPHAGFRIVANVTDSVQMKDSAVRLGMIAVAVLGRDAKKEAGAENIYDLINTHRGGSESQTADGKPAAR